MAHLEQRSSRRSISENESFRRATSPNRWQHFGELRHTLYTPHVLVHKNLHVYRLVFAYSWSTGLRALPKIIPTAESRGQERIWWRWGWLYLNQLLRCCSELRKGRPPAVRRTSPNKLLHVPPSECVSGESRRLRLRWYNSTSSFSATANRNATPLANKHRAFVFVLPAFRRDETVDAFRPTHLWTTLLLFLAFPRDWVCDLLNS